MITKYEEFSLNENIKLSDDEKSYLWSKVEFIKKKRATEQENDLFNFLKGDKKSFDNEEFNIILNSLEYTFRKKLKGFDNPIKNDNFISILNKIPKDWIGLKYSSLSAKNKKEDKNE
jgi:hypothetical protein